MLSSCIFVSSHQDQDQPQLSRQLSPCLRRQPQPQRTHPCPRLHPVCSPSHRGLTPALACTPSAAPVPSLCSSCFFLSLPPQPTSLSPARGNPAGRHPPAAWVAYHARGTEAAGHAAHAHALQVVVLAGFGALQPFSPRVVSRTHQLDHGGPTGQASFTLESGKPKRRSSKG